jgi:1-acyl-sn-glycerol-3-phosphate acyltransferase
MRSPRSGHPTPAPPRAIDVRPVGGYHAGMEYIPHHGGIYRSPERKIGLFKRLFPSVAFYLRYLQIVLACSRQAKQGRYGTHEWALSSSQIREALEGVGVRFEITGLEHLAGMTGPFVVAANHMSTLETMVLPSVLVTFHNATFIIKRSLTEYPLFKHVMLSREPIAVSQLDPREDFKTVMEEGPDRLRRGYAVVVFPEASRRRVFNPSHFNKMGEKLAQRGNVPLIPLALKTDAWSLGRPIADFGRIRPERTVHFAFGPPHEIAAPVRASLVLVLSAAVLVLVIERHPLDHTLRFRFGFTPGNGVWYSRRQQPPRATIVSITITSTSTVAPRLSTRGQADSVPCPQFPPPVPPRRSDGRLPFLHFG